MNQLTHVMALFIVFCGLGQLSAQVPDIYIDPDFELWDQVDMADPLYKDLAVIAPDSEIKEKKKWLIPAIGVGVLGVATVIILSGDNDDPAGPSGCADSDGDGICDTDDSCPELDNELIGTACDDGLDCTVNDIFLSSCICMGTPADSDNDGVCDEDDLCPGFNDLLIGTSCDDGDACTSDDIWTTSCACEGTLIDYSADFPFLFPTFCELDNGIAEVAMTPAGNYNYVWDGNPGAEVQLDLSAGNHQLQVTDQATGCVTDYTFDIPAGTAPELFVVVEIVPDDGSGGAIIIELINPYGGPYQVCWNGQNTGTNDCSQGDIENGLFEIIGPADVYQVMVTILNGAPVNCIQQIQLEIPFEAPDGPREMTESDLLAQPKRMEIVRLRIGGLPDAFPQSFFQFQNIIAIESNLHQSYWLGASLELSTGLTNGLLYQEAAGLHPMYYLGYEVLNSRKLITRMELGLRSVNYSILGEGDPSGSALQWRMGLRFYLNDE